MNKRLVITDNFEPHSLLGKTVQIKDQEFELISILAMGYEKIVYELRNLATGKTSKVLRIFRERKSHEFFIHLRGLYEELRSSGVAVEEVEQLFIGGWLVEFGKRYARSIGAKDIEFRDNQVNNAQHLEQIRDLCEKADFKAALKECEAGLEKFPLKPGYLCLMELDRVEEAKDAINLFLEIEPENAKYYICFATTAFWKGQIDIGLDFAHKGERSAEDKIAMRQFLFHMEVALGRLAGASQHLENLKEVNPSKVLGEELLTIFEAELEAASLKFAQVEQEIAYIREQLQLNDLERASKSISFLKG